MTVGILVLLVFSTLSAIQSAYPTVQGRQQLAATVGSNPAFLALLGPAQHPESVGAMTDVAGRACSSRSSSGIVGALATVRHTRREEEAGRLELVGSLRVGRLAPLTAGLLAALVMVGVCSVAVALPLVGEGATGALAFACQNLVSGLAGVGVAAVTVQLASVARTASSIAVSVLVATYALRAAADVEESLAWLSWLSPMGWGQKIDPFGDDRLVLVLLGVVVLVVGAAVGYRIAARRDLGAGLIADRPGPAGSRLGSVAALTRRMQGKTLVTWAVPVAAYLLLVGFLLDSAGELAGDSPQVAQIIESLGGAGAMQDVFLVTIMGFIALAAGAYVVTSLARLHAEEVDGRAELLLGRAVSRTTYLLVTVLVVSVGTVVLLVVGGLAMGVGNGIASGDWGAANAQILGAALVQLPAVLVVVGFMTAVYGWVPRLVALGWALVLWSLLVGQLGALLDLPTWLQDLSPFSHTPAYPLDPVTAGPPVVLVAIAAVLVVLGVVGFRRRDVVA